MDFVKDVNKTIQLWVGYIERTFVGEVKLWFLNLGEEAIKTLRKTKDMEGKDTTSVLDILHKYEVAIRNEFSSMTTEIEETMKEKNN